MFSPSDAYKAPKVASEDPRKPWPQLRRGHDRRTTVSAVRRLSAAPAIATAVAAAAIAVVVAAIAVATFPEVAVVRTIIIELYAKPKGSVELGRQRKSG